MEVKKNPNKDLTRQRGLILCVGLLVSLTLIFMAFEARTNPYQSTPDMNWISCQFVSSDDLPIPPAEDEIPITVFIETPPPPIILTEKEVIESEGFILCDFGVQSDLENIDSDLLIPLPDEQTEEETTEKTETWTCLLPIEHEASFPGGMTAWQAFLKKNLQYPQSLNSMSIKGKVFLSFIVDELGQISDIEIIRGIHSLLDKEAIRIMKLSPKWDPGKQRGIPAKMRMSLMIRFDH